MIIGIGTDIADIGRIAKLIDEAGEKFISRCFTQGEQTKAARRKPGGGAASTYAKRFAAKEACAKALGCGFAQGVTMRDIEVTEGAGGKPELKLTGAALKKLEMITPPGYRAFLHLSLSDDHMVASAFVIIEGRFEKPL